MPPDLSIVVVNWNTRQLLADCLRSIFAQAHDLALEVVVVDNGSTDGSPTMIRAEFPQVIVLENSENVGYARAINQGLAYCRGAYVLLLNSDTQLSDHALATLIDFLVAEPRAGAVGPCLILPDGRAQPGAAGYDFSLRSAFNQYLFLASLFPKRPDCRGYYLSPNNRLMGPVEVNWVSGACLLTRAETLAEVGRLDEDFFMYMEDVEWCSRVRTAGWKIFYLPAVTIQHHYGGSTTAPGRAITLWLNAVEVFFRRRYGLTHILLLHSLESVGFALRLALALPGAMIGQPGGCIRLRTMRAGLTTSFSLLLRTLTGRAPQP